MASKLTGCILVLCILLMVNCKKPPSKESISITVTPKELQTGQAVVIEWDVESLHQGYCWYRINTNPVVRHYKQFGDGYTSDQDQFAETLYTAGYFDVQAFLGYTQNDEAGARVKSNVEHITVTGQTQTSLSIYLPEDSGSYCVNRKIPFEAVTSTNGSELVYWYDNSSFNLGITTAGSIDSFPIVSVGVHDIMAWVSSSINSHVVIYVGNPFTIEYDHQQSFDVFPKGSKVVEDAFKHGYNYLDIKYDGADTLADNCIYYDHVTDYYALHAQTDGHGNTIYPGYLCGIQAFLDPNGYVIDDVLGIGSYKNWAFVCVQLADMDDAVSAVAIHELGHERAKLPELCSDTGGVNPFHNDPACVMGTFPIAICTGENIVKNPHFCQACCDSLKKITW